MTLHRRRSEWIALLVVIVALVVIVLAWGTAITYVVWRLITRPVSELIGGTLLATLVWQILLLVQRR